MEGEIKNRERALFHSVLSLLKGSAETRLQRWFPSQRPAVPAVYWSVGLSRESAVISGLLERAVQTLSTRLVRVHQAAARLPAPWRRWCRKCSELVTCTHLIRPRRAFATPQWWVLFVQRRVQSQWHHQIRCCLLEPYLHLSEFWNLVGHEGQGRTREP